MLELAGVEVPTQIEKCRKVWIYKKHTHWVLSTRAHIISTFKTEVDAENWWFKFERLRGHQAPTKPKKTKPIKKVKNKSSLRHTGKTIRANKASHRMVRQPPSRQWLLGKINQGAYDKDDSLLKLMPKVGDDQDLRKAIKQRLKLVSPNVYLRRVGPLELRAPLGSKLCYCANPTSHEQIADEIITHSVINEALLCDACWDIDIAATWGYYGWSKKIIDKTTWRLLCEERGNIKFATY